MKKVQLEIQEPKEYKEYKEFNLRKSNTEPVVRLNVEARGDIELMRAKTDELLERLGQH